MIIRPEAEADLAEAFDWYEAQRTGLGDEFLLCAEEALSRINRSPAMYAIVHRETRKASVRRFPYWVYFRLVMDEPVVIVSRPPRKPVLRSAR